MFPVAVSRILPLRSTHTRNAAKTDLLKSSKRRCKLSHKTRSAMGVQCGHIKDIARLGKLPTVKNVDNDLARGTNNDSCRATIRNARIVSVSRLGYIVIECRLTDGASG